ncbi:hypothetical protein [Stigmatella aurantiaca]|uniref:Uncharacterized protein n=1 Tax=Stigmatella aurantiaca (strain DW4/3-1) TaxID=378806 RepID=E3FM08_STIAD|nr:hypothetical protein [Stigmatella aurantiaca]ADO68012.1 uncharacterized protein STAUR_0203 [Stigmatella aurantiaca DW4/3-1]
MTQETLTSLDLKRTDEKTQFRESLERNRRKMENWPEWMRRGSVGEQIVRETAFEGSASPQEAATDAQQRMARVAQSRDTSAVAHPT